MKSPNAEKESSTTVKFNVGGKIFEISKSLLELFPGTMLAEKASSSSSSAPIFVDRDGDRFAYCLDYMRDNGTVYLPDTVSKLALVKDLKYLGFSGVDESKILSDEKSQEHFMIRFHHVRDASNKRIVDLGKEAKTLETELAAKKQEVGALEGALLKKTKEIQMEKVVLRCLGTSVASTQDCFKVNYKDFSALTKIHTDKYFIERCDKFGLHVDGKDTSDYEPWNFTKEVHVTRKYKSNAEEAHQE